MQAPQTAAPAWPVLNYTDWRDTATTLHLWTQIVGKVRMALTPWLNHGWQVPLYVNVRGLGTSPIHTPHGILEIDFDFVDHRLVLRTSEGVQRSVALQAMTVARFYREVMAALAAIGVDVAINPEPSEWRSGIPFPDDTVHASYDAAAVQHFWRVLMQADRVFKLFRTAWLGKSSPVHFFWGSFDLAVTRFSGRPAPRHPGGIPGLPDAVTREAYSHEVSSAGFWPGSDVYPHAAFFSYVYPAPPDIAQAPVEPAGSAFWSAKLGEWLLPYEAMRATTDPDTTLLRFLQSTYGAAAERGGWDRTLECAIGAPGRPRQVT